MLKTLAFLVLFVVSLPSYGSEETAHAKGDKQAGQNIQPPATIIQIQQDAPATKPDSSENAPENFIARHTPSEKVTSFGLLLVGLGGVIAAGFTLRAIKRQGDLMEYTAMLKKWLPILAVIFIVLQTAAPVPGQTADDHAKKGDGVQAKSGNDKGVSKSTAAIQKKSKADAPQQQPNQPSTQDHQDSVSISNSAAVANKRDWIDYTALGISVLLLAITFGGVFVAWRGLPGVLDQARSATVAAAATMKQAEYIVTSERAWMVAEPESPKDIPRTTSPWNIDVFIRFINSGKSPAFLFEIATSGQVVPRDRLPDFPMDYVQQWDALPLLPGSSIPRHHNRITTDKALSLYTGSVTLWIYGYIKYGDVFENRRETWFCYRWEPVSDSGISEWFPDGPAGYNRCD